MHKNLYDKKAMKDTCFYQQIPEPLIKNYGLRTASILSSILRYAAKYDEVFIVQSTLARESNCCTRTIQRAIARLKKDGILTTKRISFEDKRVYIMVNYEMLEKMFKTLLKALPKRQKTPNQPDKMAAIKNLLPLTYVSIYKREKKLKKEASKKPTYLPIHEMHKIITSKTGITVTFTDDSSRSLGAIRKFHLMEDGPKTSISKQQKLFKEGLDDLMDYWGKKLDETKVIQLSNWNKIKCSKAALARDTPPPSLEENLLTSIQNSDDSPSLKERKIKLLKNVTAPVYASWFTDWKNGKLVFQNAFKKDYAKLHYQDKVSHLTNWEILPPSSPPPSVTNVKAKKSLKYRALEESAGALLNLFPSGKAFMSKVAKEKNFGKISGDSPQKLSAPESSPTPPLNNPNPEADRPSEEEAFCFFASLKSSLCDKMKE